MSTRNRLRTAVLFCMAVLFIVPVQASENPINSSPIQDPGLLAQEAAAASGQFLMVLFQKTSDPSPLTEAFDAVRKSMAGSMMSVVINTENPKESGLVNQYNVRWAPLPLVVVLAPNSAITGSFKASFTQDQVKAALLSPISQQCLLAFQQRKLVFVCVQGKGTTGNTEAMDGVTQFRNDPSLGKIAEVVVIDPGDPLEKALLGQLRINPQSPVAETLLLAPPGKVLGKWTGATSKDAFTQVLIAQAKAQQACQTPGCQDPTCVTPPAAAQGGVK